MRLQTDFGFIVDATTMQCIWHIIQFDSFYKQKQLYFHQSKINSNQSLYSNKWIRNLKFRVLQNITNFD